VGASFGATLAPMLGGGALPAIFGLAAYLAGVTQAPLTAALIVIEMLDAWPLAPAVLLTSLVAFASSRLLVRESVYEGLRRNL
jgi:H+/Cl- antiporter ClcA